MVLDGNLTRRHFFLVLDLWNIDVEDSVIDPGSDLVKLGVVGQLQSPGEGTTGPVQAEKVSGCKMSERITGSSPLGSNDITLSVLVDLTVVALDGQDLGVVVKRDADLLGLQLGGEVSRFFS